MNRNLGKHPFAALSCLAATLTIGGAAFADTIEWDGVSITEYHYQDGKSVAFPAGTDVRIVPTNDFAEITADITVDGNLSVVASYAQEVHRVGFLPGANKTETCFAGCKLSEIELVTAKMSGAWLGGKEMTDVTCFIFDRTDTSFTAQFQCVDGGACKCAIYMFKQNGEDVDVTGYYCDYEKPFGSQFTGRSGNPVSTAKDNNTYGAYDVTVFCRKRHARLSGRLNVSGNTSFDGPGSTILASWDDVTFSGTLSGRGDVTFADSEHRVSEQTYDASFLKKGTYTVIAKGVALEEVQVTGGVMAGGMVGGDFQFGAGDPDGGNGVSYCRTNEDGNVTYQLRAIEIDCLKCLRVELTQLGNDVAARVNYAKYAYTSWGLGYAADFEKYGYQVDVAESASTGGYGVKALKFVAPKAAVYTLANTANTMTGAFQVQTEVHVAHKSAVPKGTVEVSGPTGELWIDAGWGYSDENADTTYQLSDGATLYLNKSWALPIKTKIVANSSTIVKTPDCSNIYLNRMELNDSEMTGGKYRIGYKGGICNTWASGQSVISAEKILLYDNAYSYNWEIDVAQNGNLLISSIIKPEEDAMSGSLPIRKIGEGTLTLSGANTFNNNPFTLEAGKVVLANTTSIPKANALTLAGGTLTAADGVSPELGTLTLTGDAVIELPANGCISFDDSSAKAWTADKTLTIKGALGPRSIRFGTNGQSLTEAQLAAIRFTDGAQPRHLLLSSEGYLVSGGFMIYTK